MAADFASRRKRSVCEQTGGYVMYHVIYNPASRSGTGNRIWQRIRSRFLAENISFKEYRTCYRGHAWKITASITAPGVWKEEDILVVIGGDGTVNEVVSGIRQLSKVTMGYIPSGSGNDFARGLQIPSDVEQAVELLERGRRRAVNIGRVNAGGHVRRFAISSGIGFDASICHEALHSPMKKMLNVLRMGKITYVVIALRQLFSFREFRLEFVCEDRQKVCFEHVLFAAAMNMKCEGGGVRFCPEADCEDDLLDWIVVEGMPVWKRLLLFPLAVAGKHRRFREVHIRRVSTVFLNADRKLPVHLDGESGGRQSRMSITTETEKLQILTGEREL